MTRKHQPTGRAPTISGHPLGSAADIAYHLRSRAQVERPVIAEAPVVTDDIYRAAATQMRQTIVTDEINPFHLAAAFGVPFGEGTEH